MELIDKKYLHILRYEDDICLGIDISYIIYKKFLSLTIYIYKYEITIGGAWED